MNETKAREEPGNQWRFWISDYEAILGVTIVLLVIGTLNVFSSSFVIAGTSYNDPYFFIRKQFYNLGAGAVCFLIGYYIDYHNLVKCRKFGFGLVFLSAIIGG